MRNDEWKKEFFDITFNKNDLNKIKNIVRENDAHNNNLSDFSLYKYRYGSDNDIENLKNNKLVACNPKMFNDPFDCEFKIAENADGLASLYESCLAEKYYELLDGDCERHFSEIYKKIHDDEEKSIKDWNICSLSAEKDNILMWSHYAKDHEGFCIEYNFLNVVTKHALTLPVIYDKEMPNIFDDINGITKSLFYKSEDWFYENEWRMLEKGENRDF